MCLNDMKFTEMIKTKGKVEEIFVCCACNERNPCCNKCGEELCIELGCDFDFICDGMDHYCHDCYDASLVNDEVKG